MKMIFAILPILLAGVIHAAEVEVSLVPEIPMAGEAFQLILSSAKGRPSLASVPETPGVKWYPESSSTGYRNVNGHVTYTTGILLMAEKPGNYALPGLEVLVDRKRVTTSPMTIRIISSGEARDLKATGGDVRSGSAVFGKIRVMSPRRSFYLGEEVPLRLEIFVRHGVQITRMGYPEISIPNAVFKDYRAVNPENPRFGKASERIQTRGHSRYSVIMLPCAFRSIAAGAATPEATAILQIALPASQRRQARRMSLFDEDDDDFFSSMFGSSGRRVVQQKIQFSSPGKIEFRPLPPVPAGTQFIGLLGNIRMQFDLEGADSPRVGEIMTLKLSLNGAGSAEVLKFPKLEMEGFRIYPPEIRREPGVVTAAWQLIPLRPGKSTLKLNFAVFDPEKGTFNPTAFDKTFSIRPSDRPLPAAVVSGGTAETAPSSRPEPAAHPEKQPGNALLYLERSPGKTVRYPLEKNKFLWIVFLLAGGPALWLAGEVLTRRREQLAGSETLRRRRRAEAAAGKVLKRLDKAAEDAQWNRIMNDEVLPLLADRLDMAPGSTAQDLAGKVTDPALADALRSSGDQAYLPGAAKAGPTDRKAVLKALKRMMIWSLVLGSASLLADADFEQGSAAYDRSDFKQAAEAFQRSAEKNGLSAGRFYNAGCAEFMTGHPAAALAKFEAALRLAPRDPAVLENLNVVRAQLGRESAGTVESPRELVIFCRDLLRSDEWLLVAAAAWFLGFVMLALRRKFSGAALGWSLGTAGGIVLLALAAWASEIHGPYHPDRAIVADGGTSLRLLPSANSRVEGGLPAGQEIRLLEERGDFALVSCGSRQGWIPRRECHRIFSRK